MGLMKKAFVGLITAAAIALIKKYANGPMYTGEERLDGRIVVVTGANQGIGYETALDLARRGAKVYLACRSEERGRVAADEIAKAAKVAEKQVEVLSLDLASFSSIRKFASKFKAKERELHILVNNAGLGVVPLKSTEDGFESVLGTNHLGHFLLTLLLIDPLEVAAPSRVVSVSSRAASVVEELAFDKIHFNQFALETYSGFHTYARSKLYNILFAFELSRRMSGMGVSAFSVHPGSIVTSMVREAVPWPWAVPFFETLLYPLTKDQIHGAQTSIFAAVDPKIVKQSGKYFSDLEETAIDCPVCGDIEASAQELWKTSLHLVKLSLGEISDRLR